jgi:hypothetical protein
MRLPLWKKRFMLNFVSKISVSFVVYIIIGETTASLQRTLSADFGGSTACV